MRSIVTGVAGFIGSHLAARLLSLGHHVHGIDSFTSYYDPQRKRVNLLPLLASPRFCFTQADLASAALPPLLDGADYVFHQAGQPGVRTSWQHGFVDYTSCNVLATQRLLEALCAQPLRKFVYASSSSVYGDVASPMQETMLPAPRSPYGVTKLAGEHLCLLYGAVHGVQAVALRYFTVYGPRQRPDMAIHRFIAAMLRGEPVLLYGEGTQRRDFTYVDDIVDANLLAAFSPHCGMAFNIGGGACASLQEILALLETILGCDAAQQRRPAQAGDVAVTAADCTRARQLLGYSPRVPLSEGLRRQVTWQAAVCSTAAAL